MRRVTGGLLVAVLLVMELLMSSLILYRSRGVGGCESVVTVPLEELRTQMGPDTFVDKHTCP